MPIKDRLSDELESIATAIVDSAFRVHFALGPGLLEAIYREALVHELRKHDLHVEQEVPVPIRYDGVQLRTPLRLDILVNSKVIIEAKAVLTSNPVFKAQLLSYLRLSSLRLGFLINFNVQYVKDGIERVINFPNQSS